jgi:AbiV family abortive infection protein
MGSKKLDSYAGKLTPEQIAEGMNAALKNAKRLCDDAILLLEAARFPSACSLAILAIEESGKLSILRGLSVARDQKELTSWWKRYRSHTEKNISWMLPELVAKGAKSFSDLLPLADKNSDHPFLLDQIKQLGFYTDCLGKAHWSIPDEIIDEKLAKSIVYIARLFSKDDEVTAKEVEPWIKRVGPAWMKGDELMRQAVIDWYSDMQEQGLKPSGGNDMEKFVSAGLG